jgi:hypothetical protein
MAKHGRNGGTYGNRDRNIGIHPRECLPALHGQGGEAMTGFGHVVAPEVERERDPMDDIELAIRRMPDGEKKDAALNRLKVSREIIAAVERSMAGWVWNR